MIIHSKFSPRWWLSNPHLQTIVASKLGSLPPVDADQERHELDDGDFLDLFVSRRAEGPLVAIFHGLAGCVHSAYIRGAFAALEQAGFRPVLMHWRGCGGEPNRLARSYHSGETGDIHWLACHLKNRFNGTPVLALGFSLGANALLKYVGEQGEACPLRGVMAVCPPLVLGVAADNLDRGVARLYKRYLLGLMRAQHEAKRQRYPELGLMPATANIDSFRRFDDQITAPLHGYDGVEDYYQRCSARQFLPAARIPVHILSARDDPFFTPDILPEAEELASGTCLEIARHGGHVGFLGRHGNPARNSTAFARWLDTRVADTLLSLSD